MICGRQPEIYFHYLITWMNEKGFLRHIEQYVDLYSREHRREQDQNCLASNLLKFKHLITGHLKQKLILRPVLRLL
jgi:hypothetical protein